MATTSTPKTIFGEVALSEGGSNIRMASVVTNEDTHIAYLKKGDY
jgi:hypothetical protein